ncbi:MAG: hypothetical protein WDN28_23425 [Chthoniobacter sp.]
MSTNILPIVIVIGSLLLLRAVFISSLPKWARLSFLLSAIFGVASGILGLCLNTVKLRSDMGLYLSHYQTFSGGVALGLLLGLLFSGHIATVCRAATKRQSPHAKTLS